MNEKKQPEKSIRVGSVVASLWRNDTKTGESFLSVTFERLYKRPEDKNWSYSSSFSLRNLLELSKASDLAHSALLEEANESSATNTQSEDVAREA